MKNLHLISTNKPSRLHITGKLSLYPQGLSTKSQGLCKNQHIYITSDEEIKEGDWVYHYASNKLFKYDGRGLCVEVKKIILTTDQSLDGVQAIDDEFLEWFVNHSECESIEVKNEMYVPQSNGKISDGKITHEISLNKEDNTLPWYKIIIPKEEPKQIKCYCGHTTICDCGEETVNVGDIVECLTADGWESGKVMTVASDTVTVFMHYIGEEKEFKISEVRL